MVGVDTELIEADDAFANGDLPVVTAKAVALAAAGMALCAEIELRVLPDHRQRQAERT